MAGLAAPSRCWPPRSRDRHITQAGRSRGVASVIAVGAVLGLLAAVAYGTSDFAAGVASRRFAAGPVTAVAQVFALLSTTAAVALFPGAGPTAAVLGWGTVSGLGSAVGTLSLYHGLSVGRMSVVATISAVLSAVIPAVAGLALGDHLSILAVAGIGIAIPAIGLVSWQSGADTGHAARTGLIYGALAGLGFALLFIALDRAGTHAGAWPLLPGQALSLLLIAPFARRGLRPGSDWRPAAAPVIVAGVLGGTANLLFLAATGRGQLAVVAVLTAMYPAVTILLARVFLAENWTRMQAAGLLIAAVAIALVSVG
jgi:drug/metabolite transporter (DMT)-like permease